MQESDRIGVQEIHESVFVAASAELYGRIRVGEGSSIWPQCVIRAEVHEVRIGARSNLQDFVMVHVGYDHPTIIGDHVSVTHHATVHGATLEDDVLIGINAVIMDGAVIGHGSIVAPGSVVREGTIVPPHSIVAGVPAKVVRQRDATAENRFNALAYLKNAEDYKRGQFRTWTEPGWRERIDRRIAKGEA
jgi:carbonic anhydrase/acetyltransferase-like protein (isoleucine patch superfamily)